MKLENRVAIVTGAAQGIGRAIAQKLDAEGATVVLADVNAEGAEQAAGALERAQAMECDVSSQEAVEALVSKVLEEHGKVDALVNNAAIVPFIPWDEVDLDHWQKIIDTNLTGVYICSRAVYAPMREAGYGRIVNIASNTVMAGTPNMAAYVAAKGGVWGFTRALATEVGGYGITVNAEAFEFVQSLQAIPRRGESEDIAPTVSFLCSEEAGWVTGQMVVVDGGHTRH
jgi:pyridoxal 4-dehydrogenase